MFSTIQFLLQTFVRRATLPEPVPLTSRPRPSRRKSRRRFLFEQEWARVLTVMSRMPQAVDTFFTLAVLTGARRGELLRMQHAHLDLDNGIWYLPETKSGKEQFLPLGPKSIALLQAMPKTSAYVFPGESPGKPMSITSIEYWWRKIRLQACCPDVQLRDLRRTMASWMTMRGENTKTVQLLLRHSDIRITAKVYAQLDMRTLMAAVTRHEVHALPDEAKAVGMT